MHLAVSGDRPLVFAHRGGAALAPENTTAAFDCALAAGADGFELDVRLSRDGVPVVHHDARLDRTTDARGPVAGMDARDLARVDATAGFVRRVGPWSGPRVGVPRLRDVLERYPDRRVIVEIKGPSPELARAVVREVERCGAVERVCVGGFSWRALRAARRASPAVATSAARLEVRVALYATWVRLPLRLGRYHAFQVPERAGRVRVVSPTFIELAHRQGLAVQIWTVDAPDDMRRLLGWRVDALITDRPDLAVPLRDEFAASHSTPAS